MLRGSTGCKNQVLISKGIVQECKNIKKNLYMACICYHNAVDIVPHSKIVKSSELIGMNHKIIPSVRKIRVIKQQLCAYTQKRS